MAKEGDYVRIATKDEEFTGILMPRPEILEKGIKVIKLDSGYNIGIEHKKIKKIEIVKEYKPRKKHKRKIKHDKNHPTISIISIGGTISSKIDYRTGGVISDYTAEDFVEMCPELENVANIRAKKAANIMSEDMSAKEWSIVAKAAASELEECDGVVVTQGTDTLHFTTAAMSFYLKDLNKPVIFTAAQRSIDRGSSDAFLNLICAVNAAAKFDFAGVATCLHATPNDDYCILNRGTKVRKMHTSRRDAFRPINEMPLAKVFPDGKIEVLNKDYNKKNDNKLAVDDRFQKVAMVQVYPGMDGGVIDYHIREGCKGIVLSATALGHVPQKIFPDIEKAAKKVPVVIASQTLYGRVHPHVYSALRMLSIKLRCIFVEDMLPETAYVKLGWVLGQTKSRDKIKGLMLTNIAGEVNDRHTPDSYLY